MSGDDSVLDLSWRNFSSHLVDMSSNLLYDPSLMDMSIQCGGGDTIRAHRVVLASCSPWFRKVILSLPMSGVQPIVALWDCSDNIIKSILTFMYNGRVTIQEEELAMFLKMAERLEVKGLVEKNMNDANNGEKEPMDESSNEELELNEHEEMKRLKREIENAKNMKYFSEEKFDAKLEDKVELKQAMLMAEQANSIAKRVVEQNVQDIPVPQYELKYHDNSDFNEDSEAARISKMKALRMQALKEAMDQQAIKALWSETTNQTSSRRADYGDFDASMVVETEYSDQITEDEVEPNETLMPTLADGRIFCKICHGGPMQRKRLGTHMKQKHGGETAECLICNKTFSCKEYLKAHKKNYCPERYQKYQGFGY